ncbi:MAG: periplasmic heavy metal sensor [Pararhodobacter sp.]
MQDEMDQGGAARRTGRGLKIVLVLSLAFNLLVIGVIGGGIFKHGRSPARLEPTSELRALWWALPDDARRDLRGALGPGQDTGARPSSREERRARAAERIAQLGALLRADPFDAAAFAALLENERDLRAQRIDLAHAAFVARLARLSADERAAMAERLETRRPRRFGRD